MRHTKSFSTVSESNCIGRTSAATAEEESGSSRDAVGRNRRFTCLAPAHRRLRANLTIIVLNPIIRLSIPEPNLVSGRDSGSTSLGRALELFKSGNWQRNRPRVADEFVIASSRCLICGCGGEFLYSTRKNERRCDTTTSTPKEECFTGTNCVCGDCCLSCFAPTDCRLSSHFAIVVFDPFVTNSIPKPNLVSGRNCGGTAFGGLAREKLGNRELARLTYIVKRNGKRLVVACGGGGDGLVADEEMLC